MIDDVSVLICTYNANWKKLKVTLKSILLSEDINYQIVVSDDGSKCAFFPEIEHFLQLNGFNNFRLVLHDSNQGTVRNVISGLDECTGQYVKLISPGDFLAGKYVLKKWVEQIKETNTVVSFCDAIYYSMNNNKVIIKTEKAHPQVFCAWGGKGCLRKYYLLYDDIGLGAATLCNTGELKKYLEMLKNSVIFAEDNVYRLMAACGENFSFYNEPCIYYEYGSGISTLCNHMWSQYLAKDWEATDQLILDNDRVDSTTKHWIIIKKKKKNSIGLVRKLLIYLTYPGYFIFNKRVKYSPRITSKEVDICYLKALMENI